MIVPTKHDSITREQYSVMKPRNIVFVWLNKHKTHE
jgi:hypothetical protein